MSPDRGMSVAPLLLGQLSIAAADFIVLPDQWRAVLEALMMKAATPQITTASGGSPGKVMVGVRTQLAHREVRTSVTRPVLATRYANE
jgi:hypothetical protein